jgi:hypothetical protein
MLAEAEAYELYGPKQLRYACPNWRFSHVQPLGHIRRGLLLRNRWVRSSIRLEGIDALRNRSEPLCGERHVGTVDASAGSG